MIKNRYTSYPLNTTLILLYCSLTASCLCKSVQTVFYYKRPKQTSFVWKHKGIRVLLSVTCRCPWQPWSHLSTWTAHESFQWYVLQSVWNTWSLWQLAHAFSAKQPINCVNAMMSLFFIINTVPESQTLWHHARSSIEMKNNKQNVILNK